MLGIVYIPYSTAHTLATVYAVLFHNFELKLTVYAVLSANVLQPYLIFVYRWL